jgi:hypothetical protein
MTKATMITTMQERELDLYETLERVLGEKSQEAKRRRAAWYSVWQLMHDMGIEILKRRNDDD